MIAKDDLQNERKAHAQQIAELQNRHEPELVPLSEDNVDKLAQALSSMLQTSASAKGDASDGGLAGGEQAKPTMHDISTQVDQHMEALPVWFLAPNSASFADRCKAKTFTLYIGSNLQDERRDWADWSPMEEDGGLTGWTQRLKIKVFRFQELDTISIRVMCAKSPYRIWLIRKGVKLDSSWEEWMEFWVYESARPGTERVWVGYQHVPFARCIVVKGDKGDNMEPWVKLFEFWVPV